MTGFWLNRADERDLASRNYRRWPNGAGSRQCLWPVVCVENFPVKVELVAVCDLQDKLLEWFKQVPTVKLLTRDHKELLRSPEVDVVYVAVPITSMKAFTWMF